MRDQAFGIQGSKVPQDQIDRISKLLGREIIIKDRSCHSAIVFKDAPHLSIGGYIKNSSRVSFCEWIDAFEAGLQLQAFDARSKQSKELKQHVINQVCSRFHFSDGFFLALNPEYTLIANTPELRKVYTKMKRQFKKDCVLGFHETDHQIANAAINLLRTVMLGKQVVNDVKWASSINEFERVRRHYEEKKIRPAQNAYINEREYISNKVDSFYLQTLSNLPDFHLSLDRSRYGYSDIRYPQGDASFILPKFAQEYLGIDVPIEIVDAMETLSYNCYAIIYYPGFTLACERPEFVSVSKHKLNYGNTQYLSNTEGESLRFANGEVHHTIFGNPVDPKFIYDLDNVDADQIYTSLARKKDVFAEIVSKFGTRKYLTTVNPDGLRDSLENFDRESVINAVTRDEMKKLLFPLVADHAGWIGNVLSAYEEDEKARDWMWRHR